MNMPGFNAAVSLYVGSQSYSRNIRASKVGAAAQIVAHTSFFPPLIQLGTIQILGCSITGDHLLWAGNPSEVTIPEGTPVSYTAKLVKLVRVNAGAYSATGRLLRPIPPHNSVPVAAYELFDDQAPCQAWREIPPVFMP